MPGVSIEAAGDGADGFAVADAIQRGDLAALRDELGDLLFQVVFHAEMARERAAFDFEAVVAGLVEKLVERHPHVFADTEHASEAELHQAWETRKADDRERRAGGRPLSQLDDVPLALPALSRAQKLQRRASRVGFDWPAYEPVMEKLAEEVDELTRAIESNQADAIRAEFGDVLFTLVNLGRHLGLDAERSLRESNQRFSDRFRRVEALARAQGVELADCTAERLDAYWNQAKRELREPD